MKRSMEKNSYEWSDCSPTNVQLGRPSYLTHGSYSGLSYGTPPVSIVREEPKASHDISYSLNSPPSLISHAHIPSVVLNKTKYAFVNISWWIYLITCYSLLLDTCILQSRGIVLLRSFFRKYANRKSGSYLLLFILLPCLATGGYKYFALHGLNSKFPLTNHSHATLPNHDDPLDQKLPEAKPDNTARSAEGKFLELTIQKDLTEKLKLINEEVKDLRGKLAAYDARVGILFTELDSKIESKLVVPQDTTVKDSLSETSKKLDSQIAELAEQHADNKKMQLEKFESLYDLTETTKQKFEELQRWKSEADEKLDHLSNAVTILEQQNGGLKQELIHILISKLEEKMAIAEQNVVRYAETKLIPEIFEKVKLGVQPNPGVDLSEVNKMIDAAIALYDADKIGLADYALESSGGIVLSTRCTEAFNGHRPRISIWGVTLWSEPNNPRVVIQPGITPGQCWSFKGFDGYLVIQLSRRITPTSFSLEHIPVSLAPDGNIASAPRNFSVFGLSSESDYDGVKLGEYSYDNADPPLQKFPVQLEEPQAFSIVELRVHSNHGNPEYTCLYRFRVHGDVAN